MLYYQGFVNMSSYCMIYLGYRSIANTTNYFMIKTINVASCLHLSETFSKNSSMFTAKDTTKETKQVSCLQKKCILCEICPILKLMCQLIMYSFNILGFPYVLVRSHTRICHFNDVITMLYSTNICMGLGQKMVKLHTCLTN